MASTYGYARLSPAVPDPNLQQDALAAAGCTDIVVDRTPGKAARQPQLAQLLVKLSEGDALVVWRLDRLARTQKRLITIIAVLGERGIAFRSLTEGFDTTRASGDHILEVITALARCERDLIIEQTRLGIVDARARGRHGGRRPVMTTDKEQLAQQMYDSGEWSIEEIARTFGVTRMTVYRHLDYRTQSANGT